MVERTHAPARLHDEHRREWHEDEQEGFWLERLYEEVGRGLEEWRYALIDSPTCDRAHKPHPKTPTPTLHQGVGAATGPAIRCDALRYETQYS